MSNASKEMTSGTLRERAGWQRLMGRVWLGSALMLGAGCASLPYKYGKNIETPNTYKLPPGEPQIVRGRPYAFLDASDWIWPGSLLTKLVLLNWKMDRHYISPETEQALREYLEANDLQNVKVYLNTYSVANEWRRLVRNKAVGAGWRYTLGVLSLVYYTILPGRFFGGDAYNPYSNSIYIYSDLPAVLLHEGGHAKDFAPRKWKGSYAFAYAIPFFSLYVEAQATSDALGYLRTNGSLEYQKAGYRQLYPAFGTYVGGNFGQFLAFPWYYVAYAAGVIPGHVIGQIKALTLDDVRYPASTELIHNNMEPNPDAPVKP